MSRFVLSCTSSSTRIPGRDEMAECFIHAPQAGYRAWAAQSPLFWWPGMTRWANLETIRASAAEAGLPHCTEVYGGAFPTESIEAARRAAPFRALLFEVAQKLGSPLVVITGRPRRDGGLEATIAGIKALLPLIAHSPVRLALEPHYGSQIQFLEDYDAIFNQIDSAQVGITLDTGHFHAAGVDWQRLIARHAGRIYNVHIKDQRGTQSVPLGAGEIDLRGYIQALQASGYQGALAVELEVEDPENLPRYCGEGFVYLRDLVQHVTGQTPD